jgi:hypothetical protein
MAGAASLDYVVSLTTVPSRRETLQRVVDALLRMTPPPRAVHVWAVHESSARALRPDERVRVRVTEDRGPCTKILPMLEVSSPRDLIMVVDDDKVAAPSKASRLLEPWRRNSSAELCACFTTIPRGCDGYLVRAQSLRELPRLCSSVPASCLRIDDDLVTLALLRARVRLVKVHRGPEASLHASLNYSGLLQRSGGRDREEQRRRLREWVRRSWGRHFDLSVPEPRRRTLREWSA